MISSAGVDDNIVIVFVIIFGVI